MQPTYIMLQRARKPKQTVAEKGRDGSRRQEVKDRGGGRSLRMGGENGTRGGEREREFENG